MRLYIHWPFCRSRCSYCDFNSRVAPGRVVDAYRRALRKELEMWAYLLEGRGGCLRSVYLGGGTPSCLSGAEVAGLLAAVTGAFGLHEEAEVTVEVNPATWSEKDFRDAVEGGVDRLSIGVQSLEDGVLRLLGRPHGAAEARRALRTALSSGARSVGADLLYGLPDPGGRAFRNSLEEVAALGIPHLSIYALTLSEEAPLARRAESGEVALPSEDAVADEYLEACEALDRRGYEHYEISNFCLPGHRCRHNLSYWRREDYLGLGAGAHSMLGGVRFWNQRSVLRYLRVLEEGRLPVAGAERVAGEEAREEMVMLGLRTARGVPERTLRRSRERLRELARAGLLALEGGRVRLTPRGMLVSNAIISELAWGGEDAARATRCSAGIT
ncbi:MAG: radical SAM family heme chaperone HemW [Actinobacteria bacterium]|nr:radical SAM family heme chaperone HemW [Actinomycetota bacterium]MDI6829931.1 radical SAM family heme chaperone HemW [Actinomycetota bacterium]